MGSRFQDEKFQGEETAREIEIEEWRKLHEEACARGERTYTDPTTGFQVFTRLYHLERGSCCKSGCRHCAYGFRKEPEQR